jgi:hypothetical protein
MKIFSLFITIKAIKQHLQDVLDQEVKFLQDYSLNFVNVLWVI